MSKILYKRLSHRPYWKWFRALFLYELNEIKQLVALIENETIPDKIRKQIASIVSGQYSPNKNSASKLKVKPVERLNLLERLYDYEDEQDDLLRIFYKRKAEFELESKNWVAQSTENDSDRDYLTKKNEFSRGEYFEKERDVYVKENFEETCLKFGETPGTIRPSYVKFKSRLQEWPYL